MSTEDELPGPVVDEFLNIDRAQLAALGKLFDLQREREEIERSIREGLDVPEEFLFGDGK